MRNPLKQGLKHCKRSKNESNRIGRNAKSTKTRIETCSISGYAIFYKGSRNAKSTKTRIETWSRWLYAQSIAEVAMRNPLKQGLKRSISLPHPHPKYSRNAKSTKTRIETKLVVFVWIRCVCRNAKSTKTRIETYRYKGCSFYYS